MSVELQWNGLEDLKAALRDLPANLTQQAGAIVKAAAEGAQQTVRANYPQGPTGNLKARVTVGFNGTTFGAVGVVTSRAPHAWMFEHGTKIRTTRHGANRGQMPRASSDKQMIPAIIRARARMYENLAALIQEHGFEVSGS